jgi:hypothetical protein
VNVSIVLVNLVKLVPAIPSDTFTM